MEVFFLLHPSLTWCQFTEGVELLREIYLPAYTRHDPRPAIHSSVRQSVCPAVHPFSINKHNLWTWPFVAFHSIIVVQDTDVWTVSAMLILSMWTISEWFQGYTDFSELLNLLWPGGATSIPWKTQQKRTTGVSLPSIQDLYFSRVQKRAGNISADSSHPGHLLFQLLPCSNTNIPLSNLHSL